MQSMLRDWKARFGPHKDPPPTLFVSYQKEPVAELRKEGGKFYFRYLEAFFALGLAPLPGLAPNRQFVSFTTLPAFFKERLPDLRRPEIKQFIREHNIDENDELRMLSCLGAHSITDSFELKLQAA
jgi:HipA-like protein